MKPETRAAFIHRLLAGADDELILGHRNSEWCGHAPILEEDIAFANIALDEIGHAMLWYRLAAEIAGHDPNVYPDQLVYQRPAADFRNVQLVELPKGDWAFTILRQYLFDMAEACYLEAMLTSTFSPVAEVAAKVRKEEIYHRRHSVSWVRRLGLGTAESHSRMQVALDELWTYSLQLFIREPGDGLLVADGLFPDPVEVGHTWRKLVVSDLHGAGLLVLVGREPAAGDRTSHTGFHRTLIQDLQSVARSDPEADW